MEYIIAFIAVLVSFVFFRRYQGWLYSHHWVRVLCFRLQDIVFVWSPVTGGDDSWKSPFNRLGPIQFYKDPNCRDGRGVFEMTDAEWKVYYLYSKYFHISRARWLLRSALLAAICVTIVAQMMVVYPTWLVEDHANDPHTFFEPGGPTVVRYELTFRPDFERQVLVGEARLHVERGVGPLVLDDGGLIIATISDQSGRPLRFHHTESHSIKGKRLVVEVGATTTKVVVLYETSSDSSGLGWFKARQTASKKLDFLYTQSQFIHARELFPAQDTPGNKATFRLKLIVPAPYQAVAAAQLVATREYGGYIETTWEMTLPIPTYLLAFAVGELKYHRIGPRTGVWAEPYILKKAAHDFRDLERWLDTAISLFGPYVWDRYEVLMLPASAPFEGMENPRLSFFAPSVLGGTGEVVAHELAHAWFGNWASYASVEHLWISEGWATWAELRLLEAFMGKEAAELRAAIDWRKFQRQLQAPLLRLDPDLRALVSFLANKDPDRVFSQVPYRKGWALLTVVEQGVGPERFKVFARAYLRRFGGTAVGSSQFIAFLRSKFPEFGRFWESVWLYSQQISSQSPQPESKRLLEISALGIRQSDQVGLGWGSLEWAAYLEGLPRDVSVVTLCAWLDQKFNLSQGENFELLGSWVSLAVAAGYHSPEVLAAARRLVSSIGCSRIIKPVYRALIAHPATQALARELASSLRGWYHPIMNQSLAVMLKGK